jgi:hypothetical protein
MTTGAETHLVRWEPIQVRPKQTRQVLLLLLPLLVVQGVACRCAWLLTVQLCRCSACRTLVLQLPAPG